MNLVTTRLVVSVGEVARIQCILRALEAHALSPDPINVDVPTLLLHDIECHKEAPVQEDHEGRADNRHKEAPVQEDAEGRVVDRDEDDDVHQKADQENVYDEDSLMMGLMVEWMIITSRVVMRRAMKRR